MLVPVDVCDEFIHGLEFGVNGFALVSKQASTLLNFILKFVTKDSFLFDVLVSNDE